VPDHGRHVGLLGDEQSLVDGTGPLRPDADLLDALLAGDVEHRAAGALGGGGGDGPEQRRLADAGLTGEQHHLAGDQAAAQHPVELPDPGRGARHPLGDDLGQRPGGSQRRRAGGRGAQAGDGPDRGGLLQRPPGAAARALPEPLRRRRAAVGAAVRRAALARGGGGGHADRR
jgi:hypothetical protein